MEFSIPQNIVTSNFNLVRDIENMIAVSGIGANEATIFFAGRILEAISSELVITLGAKEKSNVFANLCVVDDFRLIDTCTLHWAHGLRRLSNQIRHILKRAEAQDGDVAIILCQIWLNWYFKSGLSKVRESHEIHFTSPTDRSGMYAYVNFINTWIEAKSTDISEFEYDSVFSRQPLLASPIIEELINKKQYQQADLVITQSLHHHPNELRLLQLKGLLLSRMGKLQQARTQLEIARKAAPQDDETSGILAGIIKQQWQRKRKDNYLTEFGRLYCRGWERSRNKNIYLGINSAAYCYWSGQRLEAQAIATKIERMYEERQTTIESLKSNSDKLAHLQSMNYWDLASLAEARFLAGKYREAFNSYNELFNNPVNHQQPHHVPARQLLFHLSFSEHKHDELEHLAEKFYSN